MKGFLSCCSYLSREEIILGTQFEFPALATETFAGRKTKQTRLQSAERKLQRYFRSKVRFLEQDVLAPAEPVRLSLLLAHHAGGPQAVLRGLRAGHLRYSGGQQEQESGGRPKRGHGHSTRPGYVHKRRTRRGDHCKLAAVQPCSMNILTDYTSQERVVLYEQVPLEES